MGRSFLSVKLAAIFGLLVGAAMFAQGAVMIEPVTEQHTQNELIRIEVVYGVNTPMPR